VRKPAVVFLLVVGLAQPLSAKTFLMNPDAKARSAYPAFSVGVTGLRVSVEKGLIVTVQGTVKGSPAEGKFTKGQIVVGVNGKSFADKDPLVMLGEAVGEAEAGNGTVTFALKDGKQVAVTIPVLGAYSDTWPLKCEKSARIIKRTRDYILSGDLLAGGGIPNMLAGLFLLSTGQQKDLAAVKPMILRIAGNPVVGGGSNWPRGYQGILMAEYYLRSNDASVLPGLKKLCDGCAESQFTGGWAHGGLAKNQNMGYVQGGLMNPAGAPILTALILAKECGVDVKEPLFSEALRFFYRFAGHHAVPYGDHRPEMWMSCNGKNGMLASALHLLPNDPYRSAGQYLAMDMADSYRWLRAGHTGGGFDVIWRSITSHLVPATKINHYRTHMKRLAWYYDLSRQPDGGFAMVGESRYGGTGWGTGGMAMAYTAPLRKLRITGMQPPRNSRKVAVPFRPWGNEADEVFIRTDHCEGFGPEQLETHEIFAAISKGDKAVCVKMLKHYNSVIRATAAKKLAEMQAVAELAKDLSHPDPRVRRSVCEGISNDNGFFRSLDGRAKSKFTPERVSAAFVAGLTNILRDPKAAWWETDGALYAMARAKPEDIRSNLDLITPWLKHQEWYLHEAAFWAMVGLGETIQPAEMFMLAEVFAQEKHSKPQMDYGGAFGYLLNKKGVKLSPADMKTFLSIVGRQISDPQIPRNTSEPAKHQCVFKVAMMLKRMDKSVHAMLQDEYARYMAIWKPDYQHSIWLVSGSRWTMPMTTVLESLGEDGKVLCQALKATIESIESGEREIPKRDPGTGGAHLKVLDTLKKAVKAWEAKHGTVKARYPEPRGE